MKKFHLYLTGLLVSLLLLSLNRLTPFTQGYLQPHEYLRWLDFNAMLPVSILYLIFFWLIKEDVVAHGESDSKKANALFAINFIIVIAIYIYGASSGVHEPMNYLNHRFCSDGQIHSTICDIINQNDEGIGHILYYLAAIVLSISVATIEYLYPRKNSANSRDLIYITLNGLLIALGIFANLARDTAPIPMTSFSIIAIVTLFLLSLRRWNIQRLPITFYLALSYTVGVVATVAYKLLT